jgi:hypothetical protein
MLTYYFQAETSPSNTPTPITPNTMSLVLPGSSITQPSSSSLTLGPGISSSSSRNAFVANKMGILRSSKAKDKSDLLWVEGSSKRVSIGVARLHIW